MNKYNFRCIIAGIAVGILLKFFVVDIIHVSGSSMYPTIKNGQTLVVNKLAYGLDMPFASFLITQWKSPEVGDIVVFMKDNNMVIKRVSAVGGTKLEYSTISGYNLIINGKHIALSAEQYYRMKNSTVVPENTVFVTGDNQDVSIDSRSYGFVPTSNILGKVFFK